MASYQCAAVFCRPTQAFLLTSVHAFSKVLSSTSLGLPTCSRAKAQSPWALGCFVCSCFSVYEKSMHMPWPSTAGLPLTRRGAASQHASRVCRAASGCLTQCTPGNESYSVTRYGRLPYHYIAGGPSSDQACCVKCATLPGPHLAICGAPFMMSLSQWWRCGVHNLLHCGVACPADGSLSCGQAMWRLISFWHLICCATPKTTLSLLKSEIGSSAP